MRPHMAMLVSGNPTATHGALYDGALAANTAVSCYLSHYKSWRLTGLYVTCATLFTAGFICREMAAFDYSNLVKYILAIVLIYAAP